MDSRRWWAAALVGAVASARSMTPLALIAGARRLGWRTPGRLIVVDRPTPGVAAVALGIGELLGDKMKTAPDRTVALGLMARTLSAGIAGAAMAPSGGERVGAAIAVGTALPLAYATLGARRRGMARVGQTRSGWIEDAIVVAAGLAIVALSVRQAGRTAGPSGR